MFCKNCGKEIDDDTIFCPHCGAQAVGSESWNGVPSGTNSYQGSTPVEPDKKVNPFGIAGFVIALLSTYFGVYFCIASILALVLSAVGMAKSKNYKLNGFAIAGLVISIITLIIWAFVWLIVGAAIIAVIGGAA